MIENVLRGIALLDEKVPDWREKIEPESLFMDLCMSCVLGQIFGYYPDGLEHLDIPSHQQAIHYGFDADTNSETSPKWNELTQLWKEQL